MPRQHLASNKPYRESARQEQVKKENQEAME